MNFGLFFSYMMPFVLVFGTWLFAAVLGGATELWLLFAGAKWYHIASILAFVFLLALSTSHRTGLAKRHALGGPALTVLAVALMANWTAPYIAFGLVLTVFGLFWTAKGFVELRHQSTASS